MLANSRILHRNRKHTLIDTHLEAQGFADDTIIIPWADHGYQFEKHTRATGKNKLILRLQHMCPL